MSTIYYTASSLDGFIATDDHSLAWLLSRDVDPEGPMGYLAFERRVGAFAMGASTYTWIREHEPDSWPYTAPTWVFTHRDLVAPERADVRFVADDVAGVHPEMVQAAGERDVWVVGGGDLAGQLADRGLLDEVWVQLAPVTLGSGAPLLPRHAELRLLELVRNRDFACLRYAVAG